MALYEYSCKIHGEFEISHSMNSKLEKCPQCEADGIESDAPVRLISKSNFVLTGGCWASDNYSSK